MCEQYYYDNCYADKKIDTWYSCQSFISTKNFQLLNLYKKIDIKFEDIYEDLFCIIMNLSIIHLIFN